jgi:hypothetical protein
MPKEFKAIFAQLEARGTVADASKLKKHKYQGLMSTVYTVGSNRGELVVHLIRPAPEWLRQRIWEKLLGIGNVLTQYPELPVAPVFISGKLGGTYFLVQKRLPGTPAGTRAISGTDVVDMWVGNSSGVLVPQIQKLLGKTHAVPCHGYGILQLQKGKLKGEFKTWKEFFESESEQWLKSIQAADALTANPSELRPSYVAAVAYVKKFLKSVPNTRPSFVHGDAINPSNILIKDKKVTGLIDWEWSLAGDPAWEFCDPGWWNHLDKKSLRPYFTEAKKSRKIDEDEFISRIRTYIPLWIMRGCRLHSDDPKGILYTVLRRMLSQHLETK